MANAKFGTKARMKEDKGKGSNANEDEPDTSLLRKPIQTSITGFAQARKIFETATEELKGLLTTECDLLYECKVCRNLFRSLANFVSHKRVYCKERFNSSVHGHFVKPPTTVSELAKIKHVEDGYQAYIKNKSSMEPEVVLERVPLSKDLTAVVENLMKKKEATEPVVKESIEIATQKIPSSSVAVFQNLVRNDDSGDDMCTEVTELDGFMAKESAMMKEDGKFETCTATDKEEQVIQISDDEDSTTLSCKICNHQFSTRKTLKFHMKYKHVPDRLVYPCTDCCDIFATSWSVLRHLYRVHRKTLTQIRRMREQVQSRAFRMNNMPSSYVKKKNIKKAVVEEKLTEEERFDQENQAWMDNMESDNDLPRCGGCGRSFERRAALAAHTYTCQSRTRALARKTPADKGGARKGEARPLGAKQMSEGEAKLTSKPVKQETEEKETPAVEEEKPVEIKDEMEVEETPCEEESKVNEGSDSENALNSNEELEKANIEALKKKMADYVSNSGICRLCKRKFTTPSHLCRHMASHFGWRRFGCKLCNFVNYDRNRIVNHAQTIHKLKGSEEFYTSIMRIIPVNEAHAQSTTPSLVDEEWNVEEDSSESDDVNVTSEDESETSSSRTDIVKSNRRKQSFKPVKVIKNKSVSPVKEEEKIGIKNNPQIPLEKVMEVILGDDTSGEKNKNISQAEKKDEIDKNDQSGSDTRRPVRKRTRPKKDEDFEYDFTNVMKWEANSYKDADMKSAGPSRTISNKRKSNTDSPSESSPEKNEKQEKEVEEKPAKQGKIDDKKSYAGALATMSDRAVSQFRAHLRPTASFNPDNMILFHKVPFDVREHMKKIQNSKLIATEQGINRRKSYPITPSTSNNLTGDKTKSHEIKNEGTDIEKDTVDIDTANKSVFKATNVRTLVQIGRPNVDIKKPGLVANKKQKVIVMKRVNAGAETKQACGTIQFQRIKYTNADSAQQKAKVLELKPSAASPVVDDKTKDNKDSDTVNNSSSTREKDVDKMDTKSEDGEVVFVSKKPDDSIIDTVVLT